MNEELATAIEIIFKVDDLGEDIHPADINRLRDAYEKAVRTKPLAEWQINDLMVNIDPEDVCSWSFRQGVYAAEKHHGVRP